MIIVDSMNYCIREKGLKVFCWVIMSNHIHVIWQAREGYRLSAIIRDFKKFTAKKALHQIEDEKESQKAWMLKRFELAGKRLKRITKYKFWKDDNHAIYLDPSRPKMVCQKLNYIHMNPVKAKLVSQPEHYLFSSAMDYVGKKGLVNVELLNFNYNHPRLRRG